jgi:hypothetical protein
MRSFAVFALLALTQAASARALEDWPYDRLLKEADLVVIAVPKKTEKTRDKVHYPGEKRRVEYLRGQVTVFEVQGTIKGQAPKDGLKVLHSRLFKVEDVPSGPMLIEFRIGEYSFEYSDGTKTIRRETPYLLYLKRRKDGRYEPVSGLYDPRLSVFEVLTPPPAGVK